MGVDVFFVISGYLITSLILKELGEGAFSLITFWERRIRRILPALSVVVLATLVGGWFLYLPEDFESLGRSVVAQAILLSNVFFLSQSGYFTAGSDTKPLLHTWSLAVEEQFYLLFPLFLMLLARYRKGSLPRTIVLLAGAVLAILSWKFVETPFRQRRIFNGRRPIMALAGCSMLTLVLLGLGVGWHGVPSRMPGRALGYADSRNHRAFLNQVSLEQALAGSFVELGAQDANAPISVLVWGDSHAMSVTPVIDELCRQFAQRGVQATHSSTAPVLGYVSTGVYSLKGESPAFANAIVSFVAQKHVRNVIVTASWSSYPASDSFKAGFRSTVQAIMDAGARVYVLKDVPFPGYDVPSSLSDFQSPA